MTIKRTLTQTKRNIRRSGWRAVAITFMMSVTYIILGLQLVVMFLSQGLARYFIEKPEIIGFFKDNATEEQIQGVKNEIENFEYVVDINYVSKEDALKSFIEENRDDPKTIEGITVNPFPAHLNVKVNSLEKISSIVDYFEKNELIDTVSSAEKVIDTLRKIVLAIQIIGFGLLSVFSISTFIIVFLTIGLTIYSQKDEIRVMRLVGANLWYIRLPYIIQSVFFGLIASFIASGLLYLGLVLRYQAVLTSFLGQMRIPELTLGYIGVGFLILMVFSILLSILSSYVATRRYISV